MDEATKVGDSAAGSIAAAFPLVYGELRRLASGYVRNQPPECDCESAAIVHEAYLRLAGCGDLRWNDREHFLRIVAKTMRQVVLDQGRKHRCKKRGGGRVPLDLEEYGQEEYGPDGGDGERSADLAALPGALRELALVDGRKAAIVELHFFDGLTFDEIAKNLGISRPTVFREWNRARLWLYGFLRKP